MPPPQYPPGYRPPAPRQAPGYSAPRYAAPDPRRVLLVRLFVALAALLLLAGFAAWIYAQPYLTLLRIKDAVERTDEAKLAREMDLPSLRQNIREQVQQRINEKTSKSFTAKALAAAGNYLTGGLADRAAELVCTPLGLRRLMIGRLVLEDLEASQMEAEERTAVQQRFNSATFRYETSSRFSATFRGAGGLDTGLILTRDGFHWRLTSVILPPW